MGGKAFEGVTRRIKRSEIEHTLWWLQEQWPDHNLNVVPDLRESLLGSAGKQDDSGDLDLNLEATRYNQTVVANQLDTILGTEFVKPRPGNSQIFTAVPIEGDPKNGRVQIDFMFGDHAWQKFSYWSSPRSDNVQWGNRTTTAFKGLYRTEFIKALVAYNSDWVLEDGEEMIARVGPTFFHDKGLVWRYRHRPMRKDGKGRVKALEEITKDEFLSLYPGAMTARATVMNDPEAVTQMLFDQKIRTESLQTLESIASQMRRSYSDEARRKIYKIFLERLNSLKVEIPEDKFRAIWLR